MKRKVKLFFNYNIDQYISGYAYELELTEVEEKRLLRRGCIYPPKDAKYYQEQIQKEEKKELVKELEDVQEKPVKEVIENVIDKDIKPAKIQTRRTKASKSKK